MTLEDDLRSALHDHAEGIEPSADGLSRIEARLDAAAPKRLRPRLAPRLLAAAALLVVVGMVGALALRGTGSGDLDVAIDATTTIPEPGPVANDLPPLGDTDPGSDEDAASSMVTEGTPAIENIPAAPNGVLGPPAVTPELAVDGFLGLIQRDIAAEELDYERQGDLVRLSRRSEAGSMIDVATFKIGSVDMLDGSTGYVVVEAVSPRVEIDSPSVLSTTSGATLSVSGRGEGFEASLNVELYSSRDGVFLNQRPVQAGNFGELGPYSAELSISGGGPAWIVVQSGGGQDTDLDPFAAIPIVLDAPLLSPEYVVVGIAADDPDRGLVVRNLPGTDGVELDVLPSGQRRIHKRASLSAFVGDGEPIYLSDPPSGDFQEWWNVWLPEPLDDGRQWGWVSSAYLATTAEVDAAAANAELAAIGEGFVAGLRGDDSAFASLPWADSVDFGLSSDIRTATGTEMASAAIWTQAFSFTPPESLSGQLEGTLREVLSPTRTRPEGVDISIEVGPAQLAPYTVVNDALIARFPGADVVKLTDPANDGSGWRIVNVFVIDGEIRGMIAVEWTP